MRFRATIAGLATIALCAGAGVGCGPVSYIYTVTNKAQRALAEAKAADAKRLAPYEYWSAVTYLRMAREKAGEADFQLAVDYGRRVVRMSEDATRVARARERARPPTDPDPEKRPPGERDARRKSEAQQRATEDAADADEDE